MASMSLSCKGPAFPEGGQLVDVQAAQQLVASPSTGGMSGAVRARRRPAEATRW